MTTGRKLLVALLSASGLCLGALDGANASAPNRAAKSTPSIHVGSSPSSAAPTDPTPAASPQPTNVAPASSPPSVVTPESRTSKGPNDPHSAWERLDVSLDAALAATLAALAAAIATFLISATAPLAAEIRQLKIQKATPHPDEEERLVKMKKAVSQLLLSFYCFVGMLIETLTFDHWEAPGSLLTDQEWAPYADVLGGGVLLGAGLFFLGSGTKTLKKLIVDDPETLR